jgi:DNA polymerase-3 subunit chi
VGFAVTEILFYQLRRQPIERVLPALLERSLERGWRVVVQAATDERVEALDAHLWTYREDGFLAHGTYREGEADAQPVLLTVLDDNPNAANVRFLIDGAPVPADAAAYQRIVLLFDGEDEDALAAARGQWADAKAGGFAVTYWQADEHGRWEKKA